MSELPVKSDSASMEQSPKSLLDAAEMFLSSQDVKPSSKKTYRRALRQFVDWFIKAAIQNPTREDILRYKATMEAKGHSAYTISNYLVAVRKFFEWAEGMKFYPNIAKGIKGAKKARGFRKDSPTVAQIRELLSAIDRSTRQGKRDFAILNLLIRTGLRTVEIIRANIEDIRNDGGEAVLWIQGKGRDSKDEFVLLTEDSSGPIREYLQARGKVNDSDPLFASLSDRNQNERLTTRSVSRIVKKQLRAIGLDSGPLTAHSLRHTAITLCLMGGATIQEGRALGRHADINTTLVYAQNLDRKGIHAPERKIEALLAEVSSWIGARK